MKLENQNNQNNSQEQHSIYDEDGVNEYEKMLRKLEGENRNHIIHQFNYSNINILSLTFI